MEFLRRKENIINLFLVASFAALSWRSFRQQKEIDALEAEKAALQSGNKAISTSMWAWRDHLFQVAEDDPSRAPISLDRLGPSTARRTRPRRLPLPHWTTASFEVWFSYFRIFLFNLYP
ncbi:hypothetical protein HPP92_002815 [Vanilla planifolia]|uniref:Uncharacterized protein n=1 Tax=Vanilla planifolia TaxID=51239 RepID=A0A835RU18_VANPL|nr:hypothetical protein HPP92_002815 [Vanilla planifolia]